MHWLRIKLGRKPLDIRLRNLHLAALEAHADSKIIKPFNRRHHVYLAKSCRMPASQDSISMRRKRMPQSCLPRVSSKPRRRPCWIARIVARPRFRYRNEAPRIWLRSFGQRCRNLFKAHARKREFPEPNQPDATSPVPSRKINRFAPPPNQHYNLRYPVPSEGRWPSSRTLGRDAVDAAASGARSGRRAVYP